MRLGLLLSGLVVLAAALSVIWLPYDPAAIDVLHRLEGPSPTHWLGTDALGRDQLSMILAGARLSLGVGVAAVAAGLLLGVVLGLLAAVRGGWLDEVVMRLSDVAFAFPAVLTAILITTVWGPGTLNAILAIALFNVPVFARLTRGAALAVMARDFVRAARALGLEEGAIARRHVLPNIAGLLAVQASAQFALAILAEAGLAYLGLGTPPPNPSWGRMLFEAQSYLHAAPLGAVIPGLAIAVAVLGFNRLGEAWRDRLAAR